MLDEGPKACGKTSTAEQLAGSRVYLDIDTNARALRTVPDPVLEGTPPLLIDEWQLEADIVWNNVRRIVDRTKTAGQFILTGSATPSDDATRHSGARCIARLVMRPMSLFESGELTGMMSLAAVLADERPQASATSVDVSRYAQLVACGSWPQLLERDINQAANANKDYLNTIGEVDSPHLDRSRKNPRTVARILSACARNLCLDLKVTTIAADGAPDVTELSRNTASDYLTRLERLHVIDLLPAWATHLRSRTTLRTSARSQFCDPSLAVAALQIGPANLLRDLNYFGFLFESLVIRDLRVYADALGAQVSHFRDANGTEVDAIVQLPDGGWGAIEVKLWQADIVQPPEAAEVRETVDTSRTGARRVLGVITANGFGYTREYGVVVIPLSTLGP